MANFQFRDSFYTWVPPWLRTGNAEKFLYTLTMMSDLLCEKAYEATTIRLPGVGDESNIPYLAYDRQLLQGPAEANTAFTTRLAGAIEAWGESGSALAVIGQLQAYLQNLQPGVSAALPMITIVGNSSSVSHNTWTQIWQGTPIGALPAVSYVSPSNFSWDGNNTPTWRNWLILPMAQVATGLSGSAAQTSTATASACFTSPGQNVNGVWVPATSGTPVNSPWLTVTGLSGLTSENVGMWITITGSHHAATDGCFPITEVLSSTSCVIANPNGVTNDTGPLTWSIGSYPYIGPGPAWGLPGLVFGQGELTLPVLESTALAGTFQVTNSSTSVPTSTSQVGVLTQGSSIQFGAQTSVTYGVASVTSTAITLVNAYSGSSTSVSTGSLVVVDTGTNTQGVWQPAPSLAGVQQTTFSWGLNCSTSVIQTIRGLVKTWKSAGTYYDHIIIPFDAGTGVAGSAYSPLSSQGAGNPDGTFGSAGKNVNGVWVPSRVISGNPRTPYLWDAYCQGTGTYSYCSVQNLS